MVAGTSHRWLGAAPEDRRAPVAWVALDAPRPTAALHSGLGYGKLAPEMKPGLGESNLGALVGAIVGATGALFAAGIAPAITGRNLALLFGYPIIGAFCMLVGGPIGWLAGGQLGPRFGEKYDKQGAEIAGGVVGGLVPVLLIALWGWYMNTH